MKKIILAALFLTLGTAQMTAQQKVVICDNNGWNQIGQKTVSLNAETEEIAVSNSNAQAIKLRVSESPILLDSFDVHFANGDKQTVLYGGYDPIVVNGNGDKAITKITVRYKSIDAGDKRAHFEVLGQCDKKNNSNIASR